MDRRNWRSVWARSPTPPQSRAKDEASKSNNFVSSKSSSSNQDSRSDRKVTPPSPSESSSDDSASESDSQDKKKKSKSHKKHKKSRKEEKKHKKDKDKKKRKDRDEDREHSSSKRSKGPESSSIPSASAYVDPLTVNPFAADIAMLRNEVKSDPRYHARPDSDDEEVGPAPMINPKDYADKRISYGDQMLPGEGAAIAQYVQQNLRIPRRGEIGWSGEEIDTLEKQGYVMSGSRHAVMNAVRLRKENQVYSAEEKRALAFITMEQKQQKDNQIIGDFRAMLTKRLADAGIDQNPNSVKDSEK